MCQQQRQQLWLATPRIRYAIRKRNVFILFVRVLYVIDICICHGGYRERGGVFLYFTFYASALTSACACYM